jgi:hypothetical protein
VYGAIGTPQGAAACAFVKQLDEAQAAAKQRRAGQVSSSVFKTAVQQQFRA